MITCLWRKKEPDVLRSDRFERRDDCKQIISNPILRYGIISPYPCLSLSWSASLSLFSYSPSLSSLFFVLLLHTPHCFLFISSYPLLLSLPAGQVFLILTSLLRRSWDTLRRCWERISVEFNLDQCFTLRRRNSSLFYRWVKYYSVPWSDRREGWRGVLSVSHFLLIGFCLLSSGSVLFCCCWI